MLRLVPLRPAVRNVSLNVARRCCGTPCSVHRSQSFHTMAVRSSRSDPTILRGLAMHRTRSAPNACAFYLTEPQAQRKNLPLLFRILMDMGRDNYLIMPSAPVRIRPGEDGRLIVQLP